MFVPGTMCQTDPRQIAQRGVALCRRGEWDRGLALLGEATESGREVELPGICYAFLGYGTARIRQQYREGLALCEYAVKVAMCEPEAYLNLARTLLLMKKRRRALGVLNRGLALSPEHPSLVELRLELGVRRAPVLSFFSRANPLNQWLGRVRHRARNA